MDMPLAADDVSQELVGINVLPVSDDRNDVPVAERPRCPLDCERVASVLVEDLSRLDRVDRGSVGSRDVDAEVEALGTISVARVVQVPTDGVLAIEGLERPSVGGANRRTVGDDSSLREPRTGGRAARGARRVGGEHDSEEDRDDDGGGEKRPATPADVC